MFKKIKSYINRENKYGTSLWKTLLYEHRVPTRYRHLPKTISDYIYRLNLYFIPKKKKPSNKNKIYLIYFSCKKHFNYLFLSLQSLKKLNSKYIQKVFIFVDKGDFFTKKQINILLNLNMDVETFKSDKVTGWGIQTVVNEFKAFDKISNIIKKDDYIAKIDSDILFISDNIFKFVLDSKKLLVGDGLYNNYSYAQGGCYFLKNSIISKLNKSLKNPNFKKNLIGLLDTGEDKIISEIIKMNTKKIWITHFMLYGKEINKIKRFNKKIKKKISVLHFSECKDEMFN